MTDDALLQVRHVLQWALDAEVTASHHHRVGFGGDGFQRDHRRHRLDLGDQARGVGQDGFAHDAQIVGCPHERHRQKVGPRLGHRLAQHQVVGSPGGDDEVIVAAASVAGITNEPVELALPAAPRT